MEMKHTPGPWEACKPEEALHAVRRQIAHNPLGMIICDVGYGETEEVNIANARLIAAAPDLLAALIGLDEAFCSLNYNMTREERHDARLKVIAARAAVTKATVQVPA